MKRQIIVLTLFFALTFGLMSSGAVRADEPVGNDTNITDDSGQATVTDADTDQILSTENVQLPEKASAQDAEDRAPGMISDPYHIVSLGEQLGNGGLIFTSPLKKNMASAADNGGIYINAPADVLNAGKIIINDTFNFDANPVGRVMLDGLLDQGLTGTVSVYLDDEEAPLASFNMRNYNPAGYEDYDSLNDEYDQKDGWEEPMFLTQDVYGRRITGQHKVSIGFNISGGAAGADVKILLRGVEFTENSIPVVYVNIDESKGTIQAMNDSPDHTEECYGSIDIQVPDGYKSEYTGKEESSYTKLKLDYIRGRGNSTWWARKKPYKFKLDKGADLFGMGKNKHWTLVADYYDNSHMRNRMTYWLGAELGMDYTPQCIPVEVVMNDMYYGTYLLCEQIRVGKGRVEIDELTPEDYDDPIITGGYLLGTAPYENDPEESKIFTTNALSFLCKSPDFSEEGNEAQKKYISDYIQKTENAICNEDFKDENGVSYKEYLDLDSAVDYWWIQELSMNGDAYGTPSTYLYKPREGKLHWGPLWDFDYVAWGDLEYDEFDVAGFNIRYMLWFDMMKKDKDFIAAAKARWKAIDEKLVEITREGGLLDRYYEEQKTAASYNIELWGFYSSPLTEYKGEVEALRGWINERRNWINENFEKLDHLTYNVEFYVDGQLLKRAIGFVDSTTNYDPDPPEKEGYVFKGWFTEDGKKFAPDSDIVESDMKVYAQYIREDEAKCAEDIFFDNYKCLVNIYDENYIRNIYTLYPSDCDFAGIKWSSSDEDVAVVDEDGGVIVNSEGTVTITATLINGRTKSFELKIVAVDGSIDGIDKMSYSHDTEVYVGEYKQALPDIEPEFCRRFLWYYVDNEEIATVDDCGVVTGLKPGETVLHASRCDNDDEVTCKVIVTERPDPVYKVTKGADGSWTKGSKEGFSLTVELEGDNDATFAHFTGLRMDDTEVRPVHYIAEKGSVKLTLKAEYMNSLSVGKHKLTVLFDDGSVDSVINVIEGKKEEKTEEKTEATTEKPTESTTEATTEAATQATTQATTEKQGTSTEQQKGNAGKDNNKKNEGSVKTGDVAPIAGIAVIMILALSMIIVIYRKKSNK
ncbi:MAG: CotH kinase family protein [Eubacterium sp.]|nr:CotH kinase family protein [Eubacterium sp.]